MSNLTLIDYMYFVTFHHSGLIQTYLLCTIQSLLTGWRYACKKVARWSVFYKYVLIWIFYYVKHEVVRWWPDITEPETQQHAFFFFHTLIPLTVASFPASSFSHLWPPQGAVGRRNWSSSVSDEKVNVGWILKIEKITERYGKKTRWRKKAGWTIRDARPTQEDSERSASVYFYRWWVQRTGECDRPLHQAKE